MTRYIAQRDTAHSGASDETRAMAHVVIYDGESLADAQAALVQYVTREVAWLRGYSSSVGRADELAAVIDEVASLTPDSSGNWARSTVEAAGLVWSIVGMNK